MLISSDKRSKLSVDSTSEKGNMFLDFKQGGSSAHLRVLALMERAGNSAFFKHKPGNEVQMTFDDWKKILMRIIENDPEKMLKYEQLKAQYDFKDSIPKDGLIVKYREGLDRETAEHIKYGLLEYIVDFQVFVSEKHTLADFFDTIEPPFAGYLLFICVLMLLLSFFMMTVSFSQKMRDLEWEQGVLRAIGLSKAQSKRVFLYEAFCVVVTSLVTGIIVGLFGTLLFSFMM